MRTCFTCPGQAGLHTGRPDLPDIVPLMASATAFSAPVRVRLRDFAERPRRVVHPGYHDEVRQDEALRASLRSFLRDLAP